MLLPLLGIIVAGILTLILLEEMRLRRQVNDQREREALIAVLSHQLRTQMTGIRWYADMFLQGEFGQLSVAGLAAAELIQLASERTSKILTKFLEYTQVERADVTSVPTTLDAALELRKMLPQYRERAKRNHVALTEQIGQEHLPVFVDPMLFYAVVEPIIENAIAYTKFGGSVTVTATELADVVAVTVKDSGVGIPDAEKGKVFSKFFRGSQAKLLVPDGNGLGLYLGRTLLRRIGGDIRFSSEEGIGTTFTITLPKALHRVEPEGQARHGG